MKYLSLAISLFLFGQSYAQDALELELFELPDVMFKKVDTPEGYSSAYELKIKQPLDHKDESKGHFYQRVFLSHKGFDNPTAIITNGYGRPTNNITEVAKLTNSTTILTLNKLLPIYTK